MFTIAFEASRSLVRAKMWGFLDVADVAEFSRQEQQGVQDMGCGSGEFLLLIDTEGTAIQSQEVVNAFVGIVADSPLKAKRIAVVRGTSLTRLQTERILRIRDNAAIFAKLSDAEAWLFADDAQAKGLTQAA